MARPKASSLDFINTGLDLYSANKLRKMGNEFDSVRRSHELGTKATLAAISGVAELQAATMVGMKGLSDQLTSLSEISWNIANYFEQKEAKENFIGDLKLILIKFEDELDSIDKISEEYTEYAAYQVETLQLLVKKNNVRIEHFKTLPPNDIKWAKSVIERIENTGLMLNKILTEEEG